MQDSLNKWLEAGYRLLAFEGPKAIHVERLARELNLNKSGFYHHFGSRDVYLSLLMKYHIEQNDKFNQDIEKAKNYDPEFLKIAIRYKTEIMVQIQLRKHSDIPLFRDTFRNVYKKNEKYIIPLWADFIKIPDNYPIAEELYDIYRDVAFMRITSPDKFEEELQRVTQIFFRILSTLKRHSHLIGSFSDKTR